MSSADGNRIGIIGAGRLGQAMARRRDPRRPLRCDRQQPRPGIADVGGLGPRRRSLGGHPADAAGAAIVVIAVPWDRVPQAVNGLPWDGQVVIDATNDWAADDLDGRTSSEIVADLVAGARVVKAANTLGAEVLASDPRQADGQRVMFISGDNDDAKAAVLTLFQDADFAAIDLGDLATGGAMQQIHHPLAGVNLIRLG